MEPKEKKETDKKKKKLGSPLQTMFRVTCRNQITLIRIADTKANMILGINSMIVSVILGVLGSRLIFDEVNITENNELVIPIVIIMLTSLISATYAIQATRPRLLKPSKKAKSPEDTKRSYLFFENVYGLTQEQYLNKMTELLNSNIEVYESMIIDIFNQSTVLHHKYRLLRYSYFSFLIGFICTILSFLLFWLII